MKMRGGAARLRPAETMKANTGNGKLAGTKGRKSGHCELQRTVRGKVPWISGLGKHEKRERENGRKRRTKRSGIPADYERYGRSGFPILSKTTDFGADIDSRGR